MLDHTVPYIILILNTIIFHFGRKLNNRFIVVDSNKQHLSLVVKEVIATLELCADCAELSVVWELHGNFGYGLTLFLLSVWWCLDWDDAEACPCGLIEDCFLCGKKLTDSSIVLKLIGQGLGAYFTWQYANTLWSFHLIDVHKSLNTAPCQAGLQVSMIHGAIVEAIITFISRIIALESPNWPSTAAAVINSLTTVSLCILALDSSGGFFNPILASALTLNCQGNNLVEHIFVYWLASLAGGMIARTIHIILRGQQEELLKSKEE